MNTEKMIIQGKEIEFKGVSVGDALKIKTALMVAGDEKSSIENKCKSDEIIREIMFKYIKVKNDGEWLESVSEPLFTQIFGDELAGVAGIEAYAFFVGKIMGFLQSSAIYQRA